ncbi:MAG TPA: tryptophan dimethylallyltransferase family protein [Polyangiaceae bacterium]|nr:tryptophan dimethylallyltransferase family protein [Polyangiaceae bacterium]
MKLPLGTYAAECEAGLRSVAKALGREADLPRLTEVAACMMDGWGALPVPDVPPRASRIGDDHSPFEYSLGFDPDGVDLRLLLEAQGTPPSAPANLEAALALNNRLVARYSADIARFDVISDLFLEQSTAEPFALWHAISLSPDGELDFKLYLNPQTRGRALAFPLVQAALLRLGFSTRAVECVERAMPREGIDELGYFSLDMSSEARARVKLYVSHPRITAYEVDSLFEVCPQHRKGDVIEFCRAMTGRSGSFASKPLMSCLSFVAGSDEPSAATLHLPIAHYVSNDDEVRDRFSAFLRKHGLDHAGYEAALLALSRRPLGQGPGVQSYASFRRQGSGLRLTGYFSPELFR